MLNKSKPPSLLNSGSPKTKLSSSALNNTLVLLHNAPCCSRQPEQADKISTIDCPPIAPRKSRVTRTANLMDEWHVPVR